MIWNKVSEVLPRDNQRVLVAIKLHDRPMPDYELLRYRRGIWLDQCNEELAQGDRVMAWAPIVPYTEG